MYLVAGTISLLGNTMAANFAANSPTLTLCSLCQRRACISATCSAPTPDYVCMCV